MLRFHVANSLTGRIVGRLHPTSWEWTDPLTGQAEGTFTVPLTAELSERQRLAFLLVPHIHQVVAQDEQGRWWFGGPIMGDPAREGETLTVTTSDWRAWFYAAPIRPDLTTEARVDYIHVASGSGQVEQCQAIADLAALALDTTGAPRIVVDTPPDSEVMRDVTHRMFKMTGEAMDNISQREGAPDWWTYPASDPSDPLSVVAHLRVGYPERNELSQPLAMRHQLDVSAFRHERGRPGNNVLSLSWPRGSTPPSRVFGVGPTPPPGEEWAVAEDPGLADGERLAWDEVWQLPDGVNTPDSAFEHALARLEAHSEALGAVEVTLDPDAFDLGSWGPGDRTRLIVDDGWRDLDLTDRRILSRTLRGRGGHVTEVTASVNLSTLEQDIEDPEEVVDEEGEL